MYLLAARPLLTFVFFIILPLVGAAIGYWRFDIDSSLPKEKKFIYVGIGVGVGILVDLPILCFILACCSAY